MEEEKKREPERMEEEEKRKQAKENRQTRFRRRTQTRKLKTERHTSENLRMTQIIEKEHERKAEKKEMNEMFREDVILKIEKIQGFADTLREIEEEHLSYYPTGADIPQLKLQFQYLSLLMNTIGSYIEYLKKQLTSKIQGGGLFDWFTGILGKQSNGFEQQNEDRVEEQIRELLPASRIKPNQCFTEEQSKFIQMCKARKWYQLKDVAKCRTYVKESQGITETCEVLHRRQFNEIKQRLQKLLYSQLCPFVHNDFPSTQGICINLMDNLKWANPYQKTYEDKIPVLIEINEYLQNQKTLVTGKGTRKRTKRPTRATRRKQNHRYRGQGKSKRTR